MYYKNISKSSPELSELHKLYERSFPADEKMKWKDLVHRIDQNNVLTAYYNDQDILAGFTYIFIVSTKAYLSYFAVEPDLRGQGYGSEILQILKQTMKDTPIVIDIEELNEKAENSRERERRRSFYIHNGFQTTGIFYNIWHVDYELLCINGTFTKEDWNKITHVVWGHFADRIVYKEDRTL